MLLIFAILRLPFEVINGLGKAILDMAFFPVDIAFNIVWRLFTSILYFGVCILIFIAMFKEYVNYSDNKDNKEKVEKIKKSKKTDDTKEEKVVKEEKKEVNNIKQRNNTGIDSALIILYKVFMVFVFLIPLWFTQLGLVIAFGLALYYAVIGVNIWGLVIVLLGLVMGAGWCLDLFTQLTFKIRKIHIYPAFMSAAVITVGGIIFASNILSFEYIDKAPKNAQYQYMTREKEFTLNNSAKIDTLTDNISIAADDSLQDNVIKVKVIYNQTFRDIYDIELNYDNEYNVYQINYLEHDTSNFNNFKNSYKIMVDNLKKEKIILN
jgi:hypothetical protein